MEETNERSVPATSIVIAKDGKPRNISGLRPNPTGRRGRSREGSTLKKALVRGLTPRKAQELVDVLIGLARDGNLKAIELLLAYSIGSPAQQAPILQQQQQQSIVKVEQA
jgi:hypothetical protein